MFENPLVIDENHYGKPPVKDDSQIALRRSVDASIEQAKLESDAAVLKCDGAICHQGPNTFALNKCMELVGQGKLELVEATSIHESHHVIRFGGAAFIISGKMVEKMHRDACTEWCHSGALNQLKAYFKLDEKSDSSFRQCLKALDDWEQALQLAHGKLDEPDAVQMEKVLIHTLRSTIDSHSRFPQQRVVQSILTASRLANIDRHLDRILNLIAEADELDRTI